MPTTPAATAALPKGLIVEILRGKYDCTLNGVTSRARGLEDLTIVGTIPLDGSTNGVVVPLERHSQVFAAQNDRPAVAIGGNIPGAAHLVPVVPNGTGDGWVVEQGWHMFGGHYATTSDSRFGEILAKFLRVSRFAGAIGVHDRVEHQ